MYIAYDSRILEILCSHCARPYIVQYYQFPDKNQMFVNLSVIHFIPMRSVMPFTFSTIPRWPKKYPNITNSNPKTTHDVPKIRPIIFFSGRGYCDFQIKLPFTKLVNSVNS